MINTNTISYHGLFYRSWNIAYLFLLKINSQLEDINNNTDEETVQRLEELHEHLKRKGKLPNDDDTSDEKLKKLKKYNKKLNHYQRFMQALQKNVDIDPGRLMGLPDGIFGMVMTLLIFGMALPEIQILSEGDFIAFFILLFQA